LFTARCQPIKLFGPPFSSLTQSKMLSEMILPV